MSLNEKEKGEERRDAVTTLAFFEIESDYKSCINGLDVGSMSCISRGELYKASLQVTLGT